MLVQNAYTGLVHNAKFRQGLICYDSSYQNEQTHSEEFRSHVEQVLTIVGRHFAAMEILEIGCGKGAFLELMLAAGHSARGIDPAYDGDSPSIVRHHFEPGLGIRGDAIVMRHVLEHIPSPASFLQHVRESNEGSGRIYIEVPCFEWILERRAWFDIFYEHVNYFRLRDLTRMFNNIIESGHLFGGQYFYIVAELDSLRDPATANGEITPALVPADFFTPLDRCAAIAHESSACAVWGAAAKGVMFAHHMKERGASPSLAIDINPAKQGGFLAGSGLRVFSPLQALAQLGQAPDIFVMNSNYLSEIRAMCGSRTNFIEVDKP